jgi:hypothetical protein
MRFFFLSFTLFHEAILVSLLAVLLAFLGVLLHVFPPLLLDLPSFPYPLDEHEASPMTRLAALLSIFAS